MSEKNLCLFTSENHNQKCPKSTHHFNYVDWGIKTVENTIHNWPTDIPINWSAVALQHGVTGGNGGQVVMESRLFNDTTVLAQSDTALE